MCRSIKWVDIMKRIVAKLVSSALGIALITGVGFAVVKNNTDAKPIYAVGNYSTNPNTYYNGITATSGKQLAAQLHDLITETHQIYTTYDDNGSNGYQKNTDQYYENGSKVNGYIYEFYTGVKWPNGWYPSNNDSRGGYNREHCWCQSNSVNNDGKQMWGTTGGGSDMHHLRPVEVALNSTRNNNEYGEVSDRDNHKVYAKVSGNDKYAHGGYLNSGTFEPLDSKKGDVARIILYTYLHYNSHTVSDLFGSHGTTNGDGKYSSFFSTSLLSLTKTTNQNTEAKALEMLLRWNANDPVDDIEIRRNNQVAVYQGNRNPFIDNSSYADAIWGTTGITSISKTSASLTTGSTTTISAIASNGGTISWTTSNLNICAVSSGTSSSGSSITLTAGNVTGTATITASVTISGTTYSKTCTVTVSTPKTLSSIAVSGAKTSYTVGDSFVSPTVTATYSDSSTADVTLSSTFTGYNLSTTGNQTVTVSYTEGSITKTTTYSIAVSEASGGEEVTVSSTLSAVASANKWTTSVGSTVYCYTSFNLDEVITISTTGTANCGSFWGSDWRLYQNKSGNVIVTAANDYELDSVTFTFSTQNGGVLNDSSSNSITSGTAVSLSGSSSTFTVGNSGSATNGQVRISAISVTYHSTSSGSTSPTLTSITLDTTNVQTEFTLNETFNYDGLLVVAHYSDDSSEDLDSFDVSTPDMFTTGNKTITVTYGEQSETYTITVSNPEPAIRWNAPTIDVYSGTTLTSSDTSSWNVEYASDGTHYQSINNFTVKLGGSAISLPYTWNGSDDAKTLCVEYNSLSTETVTVTVTQSINNVYVSSTDTSTVSWTATAANNLGSAIISQGGTAEGTISTGDYSWDYTRTLVSLASNKSDYISFQGSTWIQLGSSNALESLELTTSAIPGTIKSVSVVAATAGTHVLTIDVGGTKYLEGESLHTYSGNAAATNPDPEDCVETGTGSSSGAITITIAQSESTKKAMVIRSISVTYETQGSGSTNIANVASHKAAQRVAVKFANAFNNAMATTQGCTTNLNSAWSTCSTAYNTFKTEAAALGSTEEAYAKNLVKYATAQYSEVSTNNDCLERMMKTYEIMVGRGKTAFMSDLVTLGRAINTNPLAVVEDSNLLAIILIISFVSLGAIGGYFYLRKKHQ